MPLYIFYPCRADGSSETLLCAELRNDAAALAYAERVLAAHGSAVSVAVVQGLRELTAAGATQRALAPQET